MRAVLAFGLMAVATAICTLQQAWASDGAVTCAVRRSPANAAGTAYGGGTLSERGQRYSSAAGSWTVPQVSYQNYAGYSQAEFSSTWVGIGGDGNDQTLIQLGTVQNIDASGRTKYSAWYLSVSGIALPATDIPLPVEPGDEITASIKCVANCVLTSSSRG
jgi:Peptidase A4 family